MKSKIPLNASSNSALAANLNTANASGMILPSHNPHSSLFSDKNFLICWFDDNNGIISKTIEAESEVKALRMFFLHYIVGYTKDDEGFAYFRDDFYDPARPYGAIFAIDALS